MMKLPGGERIRTICLAVFTRYLIFRTDGQTEILRQHIQCIPCYV